MKSIKDIDVDNKKVLVRVDFNVPLNKIGEINDDFRIKRHLETIKYLKENKAIVILISHMGRPKGVEIGLSLNVVAQRLRELTNYQIDFSTEKINKNLKAKIDNMNPGEIILLENLRFYPEELADNQEFAANLARLGDIFVEDAFSVCHRKQASVSSISKYIPAYSGLLLKEELKILDSVIDSPKRPFVTIIGGAKIDTKVAVIEKLVEKADAVLLGGKIANSVLKLKGIYGEKKVKNKEVVESTVNLNLDSEKLIVPIDGMISEGGPARIGTVDTIKESEEIYDLGPETINLYKDLIKQAKTIIWNGPMGAFEEEIYMKGTLSIARAINSTSAFSIAGGGETVDFLNNEKIINKFSFVSTGGGAMLDYISGKKLPGIEALKSNYDKN